MRLESCLQRRAQLFDLVREWSIIKSQGIFSYLSLKILGICENLSPLKFCGGNEST